MEAIQDLSGQPIDFTYSVFNRTKKEALQQSKQYFIEWYYHQHLRKLCEGKTIVRTKEYEENKPKYKNEAIEIWLSENKT